MDWIEFIAALFGVVSVYLSTRENIWSWPTAIVNVLVYALVFYRTKLYADMGLQFIYAGISVYGWYHWLHGGADRGVLKVSRITRPTAILVAGIGVPGSLSLGWLLHSYTDAALPYLDATLSVTSLLAQWLMSRKVLENWLIWVVLDVFYVGMFMYKGLYLTAGLYAAFLILAARGYFDWRRSWLRTASTATARS